MIADAREEAALEPGCLHFVIRGWQLRKHVGVYPPPVRAVLNRDPLLSPPDNVPGADQEPRPSRLDVAHHLAGDPVAPAKSEYRSADARQEPDVLDGRLRDPALVQGHEGHLGLAR